MSRRFYAEDQLHRLSGANGQSNREYECSENYFKGGYRTLDEVVVVGYGTMKKSDLTGSVASVNAEEMMKRNPVNLGQGLQGAAAGVSVIRSSGDPEGGFSIRIRGVATVNGSATHSM